MGDKNRVKWSQTLIGKCIRVHSFNKYLLSAYCVPGPILGSEALSMNKPNQNLCPCGANILDLS